MGHAGDATLWFGKRVLRIFEGCRDLTNLAAFRIHIDITPKASRDGFPDLGTADLG
jgi:hypothetical protein